ncbi:MAG: NAD(P)H-dependent flavin oxidoreductase YrpB, nitropropane dioxygenase family [Clostridia bacterium]|nr:NAD(P)H-dependent flavin oxidoreductase YrpB, nitropropane dioxygenase family [Clostridia bacterium]
MNLKELKIGNLVVPVPIIQGGMAVRISTAPLAAAVANEGGIGIIAGTGMKVDELIAEIRKARELTNGVVGVNVLFAVKEFADLVKAAIKEGIDLVISGAGFSRDMFAWGKESNTPIVPIVSSAKLAIMAEKLGAAAVIVEGKEAGGHLGTDRSMRDVLPEVLEAVSIPVIGAGGIIDGKDIAEVIRMGASGVQMGTRFAASEESNASDAMKQLYIKAAKEDVVHVKSPVGLPGQAIRNQFFNMIEDESHIKITKCVDCLKRCSHSFCIMDALVNACRTGDFNKALIFSGENVNRIKEILSVNEIFKRLLQEVQEA